ncbi:MAG: hypothetical protein L6R28_04500 [Planctomycetes bacterium]|nr:hypothetical protein [Planctomycetota bacterium]
MTKTVPLHAPTAALLLPLLFVAVAAAAGAREGSLTVEETQKTQAAAIAANLKNLDHEEAAARELAQKQLVESGEPALKPIEDFLARTPSLEAKSRAQAAAAGIRQRMRQASIKGGKAVGGLQATLRTEKEDYRAGERIELEFELANVGEKDLAVAPQKRLTVEGAGWYMAYTSCTGILRITQVSGEKQKGNGLEACGSGPDTATQPLKPGATVKTVYDLSELLRGALGPGTYDLQIDYFAQSKKLAPGLEADVSSNVLRIRVLGSVLESEKAEGKP